jgi:primary-amine oxidase
VHERDLTRRGVLLASGLAVAGASMSPATAVAGEKMNAGAARGASAAPAPAVPHPLDPLSASEIMAAFSVIEGSSQLGRGLYYPIVVLKEPPKTEVLAWSAGQPFSRRAFVNVFDPQANLLYEVVVDLRTGRIDSLTAKPNAQPAVYLTEWTTASKIVHTDAGFKQAMRNRGINPNVVYVDIWAPGDLTPALADTGHRVLRGIAFYQGGMANPYDRPIEGVVATIDMTAGKVVDLLDTGIRPVNTTIVGSAPAESGLTPLVVTQPDGPSFTIAGRSVSWQHWRFRVGYSPREGHVLHQIGWEQSGTVRPIIYRLGMSEIYVPYGLPDPAWAWRTAFDIGEYNLGQYAELLAANVDVPENAVFFDEVVSSDTGTPGGTFPLPHACAIYERDGGSLWDRTDPWTLARDARYSRELVVTAAYPIGNYTYAIEYVFRLDGSIDVRVNATGTTLNRGVNSTAEGDQHGTTVSPNIAAPLHQHFVCFRIDFDVDGTSNRLVEENVVSDPGVTGNGFAVERTVIANEGAYDTNDGTTRSWVVESTVKTNALGKPTAYALIPGDSTVPYSDPSYPPLQRAPFARHPLWLTRYDPAERYAAGDYPNQGRAGEGLTAFAAGGQSVDGHDLVVWHTIGFTHHPTLEEYPVMATDQLGFRIAPNGFFDNNPALAAPKQTS